MSVMICIRPNDDEVLEDGTRTIDLLGMALTISRPLMQYESSSGSGKSIK
jgi:hypothetical protein